MRGNQGTGDPLPQRPIASHRAAQLLGCSARTLRRRAEEGRLRQWRHPNPNYKTFMYDLDEIEAMRAEFVQVIR